MNAYTPQTLAEHWQVSTKHVRRMLDAGLLTHIRLSRNHIRIPNTVVEEYEEKRTVKARK